MGGLFKPWRIVGVSIIESELSDSISNILLHFMVAHSQSQNIVPRCSTEKHMSYCVQSVKYLNASSNELFLSSKSVVFA
ncbi:MAG: hypothetical protein J5965_15470 [Aeriscardovia sp.]|nr:hypothetical protein [Aeriscardovia sp.]